MIGIIPAAGSGTRMLPATRAHPKELMQFIEKPVIEHVLDSLRDSGVKKVLVIVGHKKGSLFDYVGDGNLFGVKVSYSHQEKTLGLGHAVLCAKEYVEDLKEDDFVVFLGDTIIKPSANLDEMKKIHGENSSFATILVEEVTNPEFYGVVKIDESGRILELFEKPKTKEEKERFKVNGKWLAIAGVYMFNKKLFSYLEKTSPGRSNEIQLTDAIIKGLESGEKVYAKVLDGHRIDVGNWDYLWKVKDFFSKISDEELGKIIKERKTKMQLLKYGEIRE